MSTLIDTINNLAGYEAHEVEGLGTINIRKPSLDDVEKIEAVENAKDETSTQVKTMSRMIGLDFIVDENCKPVFTDETVDSIFIAKLPMEMHLEVIAAFKKSFETMTEKAEELSKKH